jgi:hypothetical protein
MSGSVTLARRRAPITPQAGADEMMLGEKSFEIFMGRTDVSHGLTSGFMVLVPLNIER